MLLDLSSLNLDAVASVKPLGPSRLNRNVIGSVKPLGLSSLNLDVIGPDLWSCRV